MTILLERLGVWPVVGRGGRLTPRAAARSIAVFTLFVTVVSGLLIHLLDHDEYPTLGRGLWWSIQTVTSVGYGDDVPTATIGRIVAAVVMLSGIAGVAVATAMITAALVEQARHGVGTPRDDDLAARLDELRTQLDRIEEIVLRRNAA